MSVVINTSAPPLVDMHHYYLSYARPWLPADYEHIEIHVSHEQAHDGGWTRNVTHQGVTFFNAQGYILCTITAA